MKQEGNGELADLKAYGKALNNAGVHFFGWGGEREMREYKKPRGNFS